jgi:hypothetical protein
MKHLWILLPFLMGALLAAQEKTTVTVKGSEVVSGVVIVTVQPTATEQGKASFELHCNKGASACKAPEAGTYLMVRLPKNWGMYDCANVDLYPASADPDKDQKVGEYCLNEK